VTDYLETGARDSGCREDADQVPFDARQRDLVARLAPRDENRLGVGCAQQPPPVRIRDADTVDIHDAH